MHLSSSAPINSPERNSILEPNTFNAEVSSLTRRVQRPSLDDPSPFVCQADALKDTLADASLAFEPHVQATIKVGTAIGFNHGANIYDENHNMIIACPSNKHIHFLDGNDLAPHCMREKRKIGSSVVQMSYDPETGTYLLGCAAGEVYSYSPSTDVLTRVLKQGSSFILAISHIGSDTFAFSSSTARQLYFRNADNKEPIPHYCKDSAAWYLHHMKEQGLLLAGLANGQIAIYNTCKGDKYPMIGSVQAHKYNQNVVSVITVNTKGHKYVVSASNDKTMKIWKLVKGKMRMLKVIRTNDETSTMVYLEKYQMIATTHHSDFVNFFKFPSGELKATLHMREAKSTRNMFLIKDKNAIGVADLKKNIIEIVQLHPSEKEVRPLSNEEVSMD